MTDKISSTALTRTEQSRRYGVVRAHRRPCARRNSRRTPRPRPRTPPWSCRGLSGGRPNPCGWRRCHAVLVPAGVSDFSFSSDTTKLTVARTGTTTTVVSSPKPSVSGQPVTLTAVVASSPPGAGAPTGTVTFAFGDGSPSVTAPLTAGTATTSHVYASAGGSP
ncbi:Ig-like domain-containing protein [Streptomyces sp. NPDC053086]